MVVKVLDACSFSNHFWVFAGGLTDVGVDLITMSSPVRDLQFVVPTVESEPRSNHPCPTGI